MPNIKQLTNFSSEVISSSTISRPGFNIDGRGQRIIFKLIDLGTDKISKIGYCCEPKAQIFPIMFMNDYFYPGPNGIYEVQKEELNKILKEKYGEMNNFSQFKEVYIPQIAISDEIPSIIIDNFHQTLDYVISS